MINFTSLFGLVLKHVFNCIDIRTYAISYAFCIRCKLTVYLPFDILNTDVDRAIVWLEIDFENSYDVIDNYDNDYGN